MELRKLQALEATRQQANLKIHNLYSEDCVIQGFKREFRLKLQNVLRIKDVDKSDGKK